MYCADHTAKHVQEQWVDAVDHDGKWTEVEEEEDYKKVQTVSFYPMTEPVEPLEWKAPENQLKPSSIEPPKLELKELPKHLEYTFLQKNNQLPVVISFALSTIKKARLFKSLGQSLCLVQRKRGMVAVRMRNNNSFKEVTRMYARTLVGTKYYCFLDGFLRLCNAPATFQRCMTAIFHELIEDIMEVFMDDFFVFGNSFDHCLKNLENMLKRYEETNLVLNWEKCHFMVKEGTVLGHKVLGARIEVDKAKNQGNIKITIPHERKRQHKLTLLKLSKTRWFLQKIHKRFLTSHTPNDVHKRKLSLRFGSETVTFKHGKFHGYPNTPKTLVRIKSLFELLAAKVVPKKRGMTIVKNVKNKLIPQRTVTRCRVCIEYHKLNNATRKEHFPLSFIDQMLEHLVGHEYYCFLDGFLRYFQIPIALEDQEKITFTCPYGMSTNKRMPFGLCNAPANFQRCMTAIFHELVEDSTDMQKSQENGQNRANTDTGTDRVHKSRKFLAKELTKGRTRWKQTNIQRPGFYIENKPKEEHSLPNSRIASLAIRVPLIDPTTKNENPMIEDIQWSRSKAQGEHVRSLEASLPAYKYRASSLTEGHLLFFFSF
ncbi:reverse transcriptase domain-containing protein [Tanacetum coccineum]